LDAAKGELTLRDLPAVGRQFVTASNIVQIQSTRKNGESLLSSFQAGFQRLFDPSFVPALGG
jgi:hypothetical protein